MHLSTKIAKKNDRKIKLCMKINYNDGVYVLNMKGFAAFLIYRLSFI